MHPAPLHRRARILAVAATTGLLVAGLASPALAAGHSMEPAPDGSGDCSPGLVAGTTTPMYGHIEKAHLERSPAQQAGDAQKTDDYVEVHTVWIEAVTAPARNGAARIAGETPKPFFGHIEHAHLQRSPGQQVSDLRATDDYVLVHTVWAESLLQPTIDVLDGRPCQFRARAAATNIAIEQRAFSPNPVAVHVGDTVTWRNTSDDDHNVRGGPVDSPVLHPGETFSYTFARAGTVDYVCDLHPTMQARIVVS